jgi:hypothetical protein
VLNVGLNHNCFKCLKVLNFIIIGCQVLGYYRVPNAFRSTLDCLSVVLLDLHCLCRSAYGVLLSFKGLVLICKPWFYFCRTLVLILTFTLVLILTLSVNLFYFCTNVSLKPMFCRNRTIHIYVDAEIELNVEVHIYGN